VTDLAKKNDPKSPSAAACAEAAAWIARLHSEDRTARLEAGFRHWLAAKPEHRAAFDMANEIWTSTEILPKPKPPAFVRWPKSGFVVTWRRALAGVAFLSLIALGVEVYPSDPALATLVGEQRTLTLQDGTRVSLNTASKIHVHYDRNIRRVELDVGEAYFEVAKRPDWPFVVVAGGRQVIAHGTAFLVRQDDHSLAVTLVEGRVTVAPEGASIKLNVAPPSTDSARKFMLIPGQRLTFAEHEQPRLDRPPIERVIAWQHGQVILDHTPLADAVAEMNRYSGIALKITDPAAGRAEVTGIFRVGDSQSFAQAVAETYHLRIETLRDRIVLSGTPPAPQGK
jgi:transmembrane sensor